jgi:hypothetical protein
MHFNGWLGPNPLGYATDKQVHSRFESAFVGRAATELQVALRIPAEPTLRDDYLPALWKHAIAANGLVVELYEIDCTGALWPGAETSAPGRRALDFAHQRLAAGAALLRDLWYTAWQRGEARAARLRLRPASN